MALLLLSLSMATTARAALPSPQGAIGDSAGVQVKIWHTSDADLSRIKEMGFGLVRWGITWDSVEKSPGVYDWSASDAFLRRVKAAHLRSVIIIGQGNPLYTGTTYNHDRMNAQAQQALPPRRPQDIQAFARFTAAAARRYAGGDIIWEIWNEPDMARFWPPNANPFEYAAVASAACAAIKQADPTATVIGPGAASMPDKGNPLAPNIMSAIAHSPAGACFDAISAHDYRYRGNNPVPTPESVQINNLRSLEWLRANFPGRDMRLVCSEWGYAAPLVTASQQAAYPIRALFSNLLSGVPLTIWYEWKDSGRGAADSETNYGLLTFDGADKDGLRNVGNVLPQIRRATLVGRRAAGSDDVYAIVVRQPTGEYGLVYWTATDTGRPQTLRVGGMSLALQSVPAYAALGSNVPDISSR
jgi:hypothetical protein